MSTSARGSEFLFTPPQTAGCDKGNHVQRLGSPAARLQAALAREKALLREKRELVKRQVILTREFEHRVINGLQMVVSLLSMQSRAAETPESAAQLMIAARRVSAMGRVHHQLHRLDNHERIEFRQYLQNLCEDLSGLLIENAAGTSITVEGTEAEIPTSFAIPLGFIVNELITNSAKHSKGSIAVQFETTSPGMHSLSVSDAGPGMPIGFVPAKSKGHGMKIVASLVKQIDGRFDISRGDHNRGARFTVSFCSTRQSLES